MAAIKNTKTGKWELEIAEGVITLNTKNSFIDADIDIICTANSREVELQAEEVMQITDHLGNVYLLRDDPVHGVSLDSRAF